MCKAALLLPAIAALVHTPRAGCALQARHIGVHGEFKKHVVTLLVMSDFLNFPGAPGACAYFRDPTVFFQV